MTRAAPPAADLARFLRDLGVFVALDEADVAIIRQTAPLVLAHETELAAAVYDHFLRFPEAARFFLDEQGAPDAERLARRKHSLTRWLRETAEAATTAEFSYYLLAVGLAHSHRPAGRGGRVPPHLMVGTISLVQSALARVLAAELGDAPAALTASAAWNKLLLVELAVLLMGYHPPARA